MKQKKKLLWPFWIAALLNIIIFFLYNLFYFSLNFTLCLVLQKKKENLYFTITKGEMTLDLYEHHPFVDIKKERKKET